MKEINDIFLKHNKLNEIKALLNQEDPFKINIKGLSGSGKSFIVSSIFSQYHSSVLYILNDKEDAAYVYNDLSNLVDPKKVFFFPSSFKRSVKYGQIDTSNVILRTETINKIQTSLQNIIIITYPEAVFEKIITKDSFDSQKVEYKTGDQVSIDDIRHKLEEFHFERTDFVFQPGQYSIRGSIVDIFSYSFRNPIRLDFFGDEIDTIRTFNVENQLSIDNLTSITIISNISGSNSKTDALFDFIDENSLVMTSDLSLTLKENDSLLDYMVNQSEEDETKSIDKIITRTNLINYIDNYKFIDISQQSFFKDSQVYQFNTSPQPAFNKNFDLLIENIETNTKRNFQTFIFADSQKQIERIKSIFNDKIGHQNFKSINNSISEGFVDNDINLACYTDHQIFNRYHKYKLDSNFSKKESLSHNELNKLTPGDYVVHIDHGIAKFGGLARIENDGKFQESIKLVFKDNDILFVNIHSLHRISKYKGKEGIPPRVYKLGTGAWQKLKQNTKKKVKDIAKDLIELYAKRKSEQGFSYSPDTYLQNELEASFIYEDTPDQVTSTKDVKQDMESSIPMDRLVCGDVGFGKTEVAIRAAFKAVSDSKQVAILVPTTILAMQHYRTFKERLADFPCNIDYISRLKKVKDQKVTIKNTSEGKVDVLIGTHRIVSKDIKFKNLGLLIIDEEQKFGVSMKEKLRQYRSTVDTLTLTATPIPRTLQFSLMGARDLSIINTPPPNRHPIITELHTFNEEIIQEAINYEVQRNGQVFFINNRIQNIVEITDMIHRICPDVKVVNAHGQMEGSKLEKIMIDFINGDYDVLVSTTIIESGLDIPNANTMIINQAHHFGLSDLHQLRGRVGRSNKKAFCYLLAPPISSLTNDARRRLKALEDFSELGSGFNIALQDLDIRGAGNLLGAEQSGFIADIGFDAYQKILKEAMLELKEEEYNNIDFKTEKPTTDNFIPAHEYVSDCQIDTDFELLFPEDYISNSSERMKLYRELDNLESEEQLEEFQNRLIDRFGKIPSKSSDLINVVKLRWIAMKLGMEKIILKKESMLVHFVSNQESPFYKTNVFMNMMLYFQSQGNKFKLQEKRDKLSLTINNILDINSAMLILRQVYDRSY